MKNTSNTTPKDNFQFAAWKSICENSLSQIICVGATFFRQKSYIQRRNQNKNSITQFLLPSPTPSFSHTNLTMLSIRTIARSAPRAARTFTNRAIKTATRPTLLQTAFPASRLQCASAFSSSSLRAKSASPESDAELAQKLASEIQMEEEMKEQEEIPTSIKDYLENGPFEILDTPGQEEVVLTRTFGDEK